MKFKKKKERNVIEIVMLNQGRRVGQKQSRCILEPKWHKSQDAPTTKPPTNQTVGFNIRAVPCLARWIWIRDGQMVMCLSSAAGVSRAVPSRDVSHVTANDPRPAGRKDTSKNER